MAPGQERQQARGAIWRSRSFRGKNAFWVGSMPLRQDLLDRWTAPALSLAAYVWLTTSTCIETPETHDDWSRSNLCQFFSESRVPQSPMIYKVYGLSSLSLPKLQFSSSHLQTFRHGYNNHSGTRLPRSTELTTVGSVTTPKLPRNDRIPQFWDLWSVLGQSWMGTN